MRFRWAAWLFIVVSAAAFHGCGGGRGAASPEPSKSAPAPPASASPRADASAKPGHLPRAVVLATVSQGLGAFLGRLQTEPALVNGRFRGWKVVRLADQDPLWNGVDLGPGDIVTAVNKRPIERPEQALSAFQALAVDSELRVAYERNGKPRELVYIIDDPPSR